MSIIASGAWAAERLMGGVGVVGVTGLLIAGEELRAMQRAKQDGNVILFMI
jgi:hypothetical protein